MIVAGCLIAIAIAILVGDRLLLGARIMVRDMAPGDYFDPFDACASARLEAEKERFILLLTERAERRGRLARLRRDLVRKSARRRVTYRKRDARRIGRC